MLNLPTYNRFFFKWLEVVIYSKANILDEKIIINCSIKYNSKIIVQPSFLQIQSWSSIGSQLEGSNYCL